MSKSPSDYVKIGSNIIAKSALKYVLCPQPSSIKRPADVYFIKYDAGIKEIGSTESMACYETADLAWAAFDSICVTLNLPVQER